MKHSRNETIYKTQHVPALRFEEQTLTSFAGLVVFQKLFAALRLRARLRACFRRSTVTPMFGPARIMLVLIVHCLLGYRCLRELRFYRDDPMVGRLVGLKRLPDVATISRTLAQVGGAGVEAVQRHNGRGAQEAVFAQLKSDNALAYIPANTWRANQLYATAAVLAHNLTRELQMRTAAPQRSTGNQRRTLWPFATPSTLRQRLLQRAGRLIRPQGQLTLSLSANEAVKAELLHTLSALDAAA